MKNQNPSNFAIAIAIAIAIGCSMPAHGSKKHMWHLDASTSKAPAAIGTFRSKPGPHIVVVAVIDSGVIPDHPSLIGQILPGADMQSLPYNIRGGRSSDFSPDERETFCSGRLVSGAFRVHGTEVSSLIAANGHNGVWGVNPNSKIVPIRVMGACGMTRTDLLDAMAWAAGINVPGLPPNQHPAKIINLSLTGGRDTCSRALQNLVTKLTDMGVFLVAAAGNNFQKPLSEPANCKGVISVGAVAADNRIEDYSALDPRTVIYAPGGGRDLQNGQPWEHNKLRIATYELNVFGQERPSALTRGIGTSFAAPLVSGFISLWLSHHPNKTPDQWHLALPQFLQPVQASEKCSNCEPMGLISPDLTPIP